MSLKTWKQEFYQRTAKRTAKGDALQHSLNKWLGLRPKALEKHGLVPMAGLWGPMWRKIHDGENAQTLDIDCDTCALCYHYIVDDSDCRLCPLYKARGGVRCDDTMANKLSPYTAWGIDLNPEPMIRLIRKAIKQENE